MIATYPGQWEPSFLGVGYNPPFCATKAPCAFSGVLRTENYGRRATRAFKRLSKRFWEVFKG